MVCTYDLRFAFDPSSLSSHSDAKENNRETNSNAESINEQDSNNDNTNSSNLSAQKFRRRDYPHAHPQSQTRSNPSLGAQDKRTKHEPRRKRRHSGEDRDDRNRKVYKVAKIRLSLLVSSNDVFLVLAWTIPCGSLC